MATKHDATPADSGDEFDFDTLLDATKDEPRVIKRVLPKWDRPIPSAGHQWIKGALANPDKVTRIPCNTEELHDNLTAMLKAALHEHAPEKELHKRARFDKETGQMVEFAFTIGEKRGRKAAE